MQPCPFQQSLERDFIVKSKHRRTAHSRALDSDLLTSNGQASDTIFIVDINDPGDDTVHN